MYAIGSWAVNVYVIFLSKEMVQGSVQGKLLTDCV